MYSSSGATIRGDLNTFVQEGLAVDNFFIGPMVMPPWEVDLKSGTYPKLAKANGALLKSGSTVREAKGSYGEIDRAWDSDTYDCIDRGLEELIDDTQQRDMIRFFNQEVVTANLVRRAVQLDHEIRVAAAIQNTTTFPATAAIAAYTNANIATIDFAGDILAAIERVNDAGEIADTIVMSPNVLNRVKLSTKLQNFVRGSRPNDGTLNITARMIADAFSDNGIKNCFVGRARYDSAKKGQTFASARVWADTTVWVGSIGAGDPQGGGGAGRTIVWNKEGGLFVTESYRDEKRRSGVIRVRQNTTEKVINSGCGTTITTSYA